MSDRPEREHAARRGARGDEWHAQGDRRDPRDEEEEQAPPLAAGRGRRGNEGRPSAPPPEGRPATAFRDDVYMRRREDQATTFRGDPRDDGVRGTRENQPYETPRDRRDGNYHDEGGQRGLFEEVRRQRGDGVNPAWNQFDGWDEAAVWGGATGTRSAPPSTSPKTKESGKRMRRTTAQRAPRRGEERGVMKLPRQEKGWLQRRRLQRRPQPQRPV